jgi:uncharacterized membrane protein HdeD (DUF308 family)
MRNDEHFWWTTLIRGFVALLAGSAIMVIPDLAKTSLLFPIALSVATLGLAVFGIFDSVLVFITSYMAASRPTRLALRVQGAIGVLIGISLVWIASDYIPLSLFLILIVIQTLSTAISEYLVARRSISASASHWNVAAAGVALTFCLAYTYILLFETPRMTARDISWLVFGYLLALGIAECLTAARMLYSDYRLEASPAHVFPTQPGDVKQA